MIPWAYSVQDLDGNTIGTLADVCTAVVNLNEGQGGAKSGGNTRPGYLDGERWEPKNRGPADIALQTHIRYTDEDGDVTHDDGEPGHFMENLSDLTEWLSSDVRRFLVRTAPHIGSQRLLFETVADPVEGVDKNVYVWVLRSLSGSWQSITEQSDSGDPPSVTTGGNRRIPDPEIEFSNGGMFTYTDDAGVASQISVNVGPTFPVIVRMVNGEWEAVDDNGADVGPSLATTQPWVMRFDANSELSISTTVSCVVRWRDRWA